MNNTLTVTSTKSNNADDEQRTGTICPILENGLTIHFGYLSVGHSIVPLTTIGMPEGKAGREIQEVAKQAWERWEANRERDLPFDFQQQEEIDYNPAPPKKSYPILVRITSVKRGKPSTEW